MRKKIKIIDILYYISTGDYDKLPKRIEYQGTEYIFDEDDYKTYKGANLLDDACLTRYIVSSMLNDEVEILDEEDEFEDIEDLTYENTFKDNSDMEVQEILVNKINDLIKNQKKIIERLNKE